MGNRPSTTRRQCYQQGSAKPTSTYSRYSGGELGHHTHYCSGGNRGHDRSVYIGRSVRLAEQFQRKFPMEEITVRALGKVLAAECGNEGRHLYLNDEEKVTLQFLRAAISFVPFALATGADMRNASFLLAQPGREFAIVAGKGDWEFYFCYDQYGAIFGYCVRKPWIRYAWDSIKSIVRRAGSYLFPMLGPSLLALA